MLVPSEVPGPDAADQYRLLLEREVQLRGDIIEKKTREHREAADRLRGTVREMVRVLGSVVDVRDPYTAGHQRRTADLARAIATAMGFAPDVVEGLRIAGTVHDIGKIAIPAEILVRPGRLSEVEYQLVQTHVQIGYSILRDIEFGRPVAEIVYQHHERLDGSGYPRGLKGDEILPEARILAVADVAEAMASHRPYRPALGVEAALEELERHKGTRYDPKVVETCGELLRSGAFQLLSPSGKG